MYPYMLLYAKSVFPPCPHILSPSLPRPLRAPTLPREDKHAVVNSTGLGVHRLKEVLAAAGVPERPQARRRNGRCSHLVRHDNQHVCVIGGVLQLTTPQRPLRPRAHLLCLIDPLAEDPAHEPA